MFIADNLRLEKRDVVSVRVRKMFHRTSKEKDTVDRVKRRERKKNLKKEQETRSSLWPKQSSHLPKLSADLVTALTGLDVDDFTVIQLNQREKRDT